MLLATNHTAGSWAAQKAGVLPRSSGEAGHASLEKVFTDYNLSPRPHASSATIIVNQTRIINEQESFSRALQQVGTQIVGHLVNSLLDTLSVSCGQEDQAWASSSLTAQLKHPV